jgi:hypothetical protein
LLFVFFSLPIINISYKNETQYIKWFYQVHFLNKTIHNYKSYSIENTNYSVASFYILYWSYKLCRALIIFDIIFWYYYVDTKLFIWYEKYPVIEDPVFFYPHTNKNCNARSRTNKSRYTIRFHNWVLKMLWHNKDYFQPYKNKCEWKWLHLKASHGIF